MKIKRCRMNDFLNIIGNKRIACFGFGIRARAMCENYSKLLKHIDFFIDNDVNKLGESTIGARTFRIVSSDYFLSLKSYDDIVLLITTKFFNEVISQFSNIEKLNDLEVYIYPLMEEAEEIYEADDCKIERIETSPIPKVIHYCWFGRGKKGDLAEKCIKSWKEKCPDYKIIEWNEDNFDVNINAYVLEAYECKKYAFVSDFVRLYVLYNYGGIYMDTDVEVIKPLDELLFVDGFSGFETTRYIPTGIMAAKGHNMWIKEQLDSYENDSFLDKDGKQILITNVERITDISKKKHGLIPNGSKQVLKYGIVIYPRAFFCPKSVVTGKINLSKNTYTIHHFASSWFPDGIKERNDELERYIDEIKFL